MAYYPLKVKDSGGTVHIVGDPRIAGKADTASPALTGTPTAPTATAGTNTTQIATTAFVSQAVSSAVATVDINSQAASYTLVLADAGRLVQIDGSSALTVTVPTDASVAFPTGTKIDVLRQGAGEVTITGSGVTISSEGNKYRINAQWQAVTLIKRAANTWVLLGALKV